MSLHLEFEPHSWYMGFAIKKIRHDIFRRHYITKYTWYGVANNGMTGYIDTLEAETLKDLKKQIKEYKDKQS